MCATKQQACLTPHPAPLCGADAYQDNKLAFIVTCAVIVAALIFLLGALVLCCRVCARQHRAKQATAHRSKVALHRPSRTTSLAPIAERRTEGEGPGPGPWWGRLQRDKSHHELAHRAWKAEGPGPAVINIKAAALVSQCLKPACLCGWLV